MSESGTFRKGGWPDRLRLGILLFIFALMLILSEYTNLRLAFGLTGTPGTVEVESCYHSEDSVYCEGVFTPQRDGAEKVENVDLPPFADGRDSFPAQLTDDGAKAGPTGIHGVLGVGMIPAMGLVVLVAIPWVVYYRGDRELSLLGGISFLVAELVPVLLIPIGFVASVF